MVQKMLIYLQTKSHKIKKTVYENFRYKQVLMYTKKTYNMHFTDAIRILFLHSFLRGSVDDLNLLWYTNTLLSHNTSPNASYADSMRGTLSDFSFRNFRWTLWVSKQNESSELKNTKRFFLLCSCSHLINTLALVNQATQTKPNLIKTN